MMTMIRHPNDALPCYKTTTRIELTNSNQLVSAHDLFFDQIQVSDIFPSASSINDNHFRLQLHIKDSVTHMAATFKMITKNDYDFMSDKTLPVGE